MPTVSRVLVAVRFHGESRSPALCTCGIIHPSHRMSRFKTGRFPSNASKLSMLRERASLGHSRLVFFASPDCYSTVVSGWRDSALFSPHRPPLRYHLRTLQQPTRALSSAYLVSQGNPVLARTNKCLACALVPRHRRGTLLEKDDIRFSAGWATVCSSGRTERQSCYEIRKRTTNPVAADAHVRNADADANADGRPDVFFAAVTPRRVRNVVATSICFRA